MNTTTNVFDGAENSAKKAYTTPRVVEYGGVAEITLQGGYTSTDVPLGTPVGPGGVTSVAS